MPIDHTSMAVVKDEYRQVVDFYVAALKPLGYELIMEPAPGMAGLGVKPRSDFWINTCDGAVAPAKTHVAFTAKDRKTVDEFHKAALATGGQDNGAPGVRAHYHPNYYGAFVIDPAGNNAEVVCHD